LGKTRGKENEYEEAGGRGAWALMLELCVNGGGEEVRFSPFFRE
jgi:hypothetical protein